MATRAFAFALLLGCTTPVATEPAPEETSTLETAARPSEAPREESPFGPAPWVGRLTRTTHHYSNGCVDHREVDVLALTIGDRTRVPVILGWRRISARYRGEPHFLTKEEELPPNARKSACVVVTGTVVAYAHQGYSGSPALGFEATRIDPAPCP